ncbi:MAG: hypothetical protein JXA50_03475 [Deltaproteobacteria bacterium]|nr:hypothetical protein [Deltaproteobacteria bacterium]
MKKFILGIVIGIVLIFLFTYLGGGTVLQTIGQKTIDVGERIEVYEKALKDVTQDILKEKEGIGREIKKQ